MVYLYENMNILLLRGDSMAGYSYFDYDQMTLFGIEVHSDELELLQQAADEYDWEAIETEVEPRFLGDLEFLLIGQELTFLNRLTS